MKANEKECFHSGDSAQPNAGRIVGAVGSVKAGYHGKPGVTEEPGHCTAFFLPFKPRPCLKAEIFFLSVHKAAYCPLALELYLETLHSLM